MDSAVMIRRIPKRAGNGGGYPKARARLYLNLNPNRSFNPDPQVRAIRIYVMERIRDLEGTSE